MASDAKGKGKTIVVTGGAGFIGSHLCEKLLANGNKVVCVDNFITGNKKNIQHLLSGKNFEYIEHDITTPLKISGFDGLYNLASPASPVDYYKKPIETLHAGSFGVKNMLDLCKANNATFLPFNFPMISFFISITSLVFDKISQRKQFRSFTVFFYSFIHCKC